MNTAEIVIREVKGDGGFQVRQLLAESVGQPRKAPKFHSHGQILPFDKAGRNMIGIGIRTWREEVGIDVIGKALRPRRKEMPTRVRER
jgi:hypothetical protein